MASGDARERSLESCTGNWIGPRSREGDGDLLALAVAQRDGLRLGSVGLLPRLDVVGPRRQALDREPAGVVRDRVERIVEDADVARHPRVNVALHLHDLRLAEESGDL